MLTDNAAEVTLAMEDNMTIQDFMKMMQEQLKVNAANINDNIQRSNDKLEREIKKELFAINKKVEEVTEETGKLKIKVNENKAENDNRFARIEGKLNEIAEIGAKKDDLKRKRETIVKEKITPVIIQPAGNYAAAVAARTTGEKEKEKPVYKSTFALHLSQKSLEQQLRTVSEVAARMENENVEMTPRGRDRTKKKLLLGNTAEFHTESDWEWTEGDGEWDETVNRQEKNQKKKKKKKIEEKKKG